MIESTKYRLSGIVSSEQRISSTASYDNESNDDDSPKSKDFETSKCKFDGSETPDVEVVEQQRRHNRQEDPENAEQRGDMIRDPVAHINGKCDRFVWDIECISEGIAKRSCEALLVKQI